MRHEFLRANELCGTLGALRHPLMELALQRYHAGAGSAILDFTSPEGAQQAVAAYARHHFTVLSVHLTYIIVEHWMIVARYCAEKNDRNYRFCEPLPLDRVYGVYRDLNLLRIPDVFGDIMFHRVFRNVVNALQEFGARSNEGSMPPYVCVARQMWARHCGVADAFLETSSEGFSPTR